MPPKRRAQASSSTSKPPATRDAKAARPRLSKLARENDISADEDAEIREAFGLFAQPFPDTAGQESMLLLDDEYAEEGVMPIQDVRRALIALNIPPSSRAELQQILTTLDPTQSGFTTYAPFVSVCALKLQAQTSSAAAEEVDAAYRLFTAGAPGPITLHHLRRVARELNEHISDDQLRDMILEANGGAGVTRGVAREDFEGVMRRAGIFT